MRGTRIDRHTDEPDGEPCPVCGQVFDRRHFEEVFWHNRPRHEPMLYRSEAVALMRSLSGEA